MCARVCFLCCCRVPGVNFTSTLVVHQYKPRQEDRQSPPYPVIAVQGLSHEASEHPGSTYLTFNQAPPRPHPFPTQTHITHNPHKTPGQSVKDEGGLFRQAMKLEHQRYYRAWLQLEAQISSLKHNRPALSTRYNRRSFWLAPEWSNEIYETEADLLISVIGASGLLAVCYFAKK